MAKMKNVMTTERWMTPSVKLTLLDTGARSIMIYGITLWGATKTNLEGKAGEGIKQLNTLYNTGLR